MMKSFGLIAASQLLGLILGFVRIKVISLGLGPSGIALFGIIQNVSSLSSNLFIFGTSGALLKHMRRYRSFKSIEDTIISIQMYVGVFCLFVFCAHQSLLLKKEFFQDVPLIYLWICISIIGIFSGLNSYRLALISLLDSNSLLAFNLLTNSILMGGVASVIIYFFTFNSSVLFAYLFAQAIYLVLFPKYAIRWFSSIKFRPSFHRARRLLKSKTFKTGWYLFIVGFGPGVMILTLRYRYLDIVGQVEFGKITAMWSLYFIVEGFFTQYLGATYLKELGATIASMRKTLSKYFYLLLVVTSVLVFLAYFLNDLAMELLFSSEFIVQELQISNFLSLLFIKVYMHLLALIVLKNFAVQKIFLLEVVYYVFSISLIFFFAHLFSFLELLLIIQIMYAAYISLFIYWQRKVVFVRECLTSLVLGCFGVLML